MAFSRVFCGFLASLIIVFTAHAASAGSYQCTTTYTQCKGWYYLANKTCNACNETAHGRGEETLHNSNTCLCNANYVNVNKYISEITGNNSVAGSNQCYPKISKVTLYKQSGTGDTSIIYTKHGSSDIFMNNTATLTTSITAPTRANYGFRGYFAESDKTNIQYTDSTGVLTARAKGHIKTLTSDESWYAQWNPNLYTVLLSPGNSDTGVTDKGQTTIIEKYGVEWQISENNSLKPVTNVKIPQRTGYTFGGYKYNKTVSGGTVKYDVVGADGTLSTTTTIFDESNTTSGIIRISATWEKNTFYVTYNLNKPTSGTGGNGYDVTATNTPYGNIANAECKYDDPCTITGTLPVLNGWTFKGWTTNKNNSNITDACTSGNTNNCLLSSLTNLASENDAEVTVYAKWAPNPYSIIYYPGKPTNASNDPVPTSMPSAVTQCTYDHNCTLNTSIPQLRGWAFSHYKSAVTDLQNNKYQPGQTVKNLVTTGTTSMTAQWTANEYNITLDANGGELGAVRLIAKQKFDSNMQQIAASALPTRTGYTFTGFYDATSGGNKYYNADGTSAHTWNKIDNNPVLYAQWTANVYQITLWSNPQGSNIEKSDNISAADPSTIYEWFDNGWYNISNPTTTTTNISTVTPPTQVGYTFSGFYDGATQQINKDGKITVANNHYSDENTSNRKKTLAARWTANKTIVTFDDGVDDGDEKPTKGCTGDEKCQIEYTYDTDVAKLTNFPGRAGYTFAGYYTGKNGTGTPYFDKDGIYNKLGADGQWRDDTREITLYAKWTICTPGSYCPGEPTKPLEEKSCAETLPARVPLIGFDDESETINNDEYWYMSDAGASTQSDCYRICKPTGTKIDADNPKENYGHGTLICYTDDKNVEEVNGQCRAYYDPERGNTDSGSCKYYTTKNESCHKGYSPAFAGHEIASCEPDKYKVTYFANDGVHYETLHEHECTVFGQCNIQQVQLPERTGYVSTGWFDHEYYTDEPWQVGDNLKDKIPGPDGPTGATPLYAVWGLCDFGYYWNGDGLATCTACSKDYYKDNRSVANGSAQSAEKCTRCEPGYYIDDVAATGLHENDDKDSCTACPAGYYCTATGNGKEQCPKYVHKDTENFSGIDVLQNLVYTSTGTDKNDPTKRIVSDEISDCYLECPAEFNVTYGTAYVTEETKVIHFSDTAQCQYTCTSETGNPGTVENVNGIVRCLETRCNPDYEMLTDATDNNIRKCQKCDRPNAMSYKPNGNCVIAACIAGYHPDANNKRCEPDTAKCTIPNAMDAEQIWDPKTGKFGACTPIACNDGYHIYNNMCVSNVASCKIDNGTGTMEWDDVHNRWGECQVVTCMPGYTDDLYLSNEPTKKCGECRNKYGVLGDVAVASYTTGCEIDRCMYQGDLYIKEGNECVPICDVNGYEDETGKMKWDSVKKRCTVQCNRGYGLWDGDTRYFMGYTPVSEY